MNPMGRKGGGERERFLGYLVRRLCHYCLSQVLKDLVARISLNFPDVSLCQTGHYAKNF